MALPDNNKTNKNDMEADQKKCRDAKFCVFLCRINIWATSISCKKAIKDTQKKARHNLCATPLLIYIFNSLSCRAIANAAEGDAIGTSDFHVDDVDGAVVFKDEANQYSHVTDGEFAVTVHIGILDNY